MIEAVVIAFLVGRGSPAGPVSQGPAPQGVTPPAASTSSSGAAPFPAPTQSPAANAPPADPIVRGKLGQRVESEGLAITLLGVTNEPRFKDVTTPPASQKFVGVEVLLENTGPTGHPYFSTNFKLKDPQDRVYASGGLGVGDPPLDWGTIVPGEKVRGHIAFVVPKDASGLTLTYAPPAGGPSGYRPIHVELGQ